jgi:hypothetical protein
MIAAGKPISVVLQTLGITAQTYARWRADYEGVDRNLMLQFKPLAADRSPLLRL